MDLKNDLKAVMIFYIIFERRDHYPVYKRLWKAGGFMKNRPGKKAADSVSIIGGNDGPTSVFIAGRSHSKRNLRQNIRRFLYEVRKLWIVRSLKADPHSLLLQFIVQHMHIRSFETMFHLITAEIFPHRLL